jgi:hypothetical protein
MKKDKSPIDESKSQRYFKAQQGGNLREVIVQEEGQPLLVKAIEKEKALEVLALLRKGVSPKFSLPGKHPLPFSSS